MPRFSQVKYVGKDGQVRTVTAARPVEGEEWPVPPARLREQLQATQQPSLPTPEFAKGESPAPPTPEPAKGESPALPRPEPVKAERPAPPKP